MNGEMHKNRKKYSPRKRLLINLMYIVNENRTDEEGLATYRDLLRVAVIVMQHGAGQMDKARQSHLNR